MVTNNLVVENARIGFRNFSGEEGKFNPAGNRNFVLFLDSDIAEPIQADGWNIKWLDPRDEDDEAQAYLPVAVSYSNIPPKIVLITSNGKTILDEDTVGMLDWAEIQNVDIIVNPYNWTVNGKSGVKAYVKSMYITIVEDEFADKYRDIPGGSDDFAGDID